MSTTVAACFSAAATRSRCCVERPLRTGLGFVQPLRALIRPN